MTETPASRDHRDENGRPSVCHWSLNAQFATKEQCTQFLAEYVGVDLPLDFSYHEEEDDEDSRFVLDIAGDTAAHLSLVACMLDAVDYCEPETPFVVLSGEPE